MARLAALGADLTVATIEAWLAGRITPQTQDPTRAIWCDRLRKAHGRLDWTRSAELLARQVRAFDPWPGTFTAWGDTLLRVLDAEPWNDWRGDLAPGRVFRATDRTAVATGQGALVLHTVQAAGKRRLSVDQFARGERGFIEAMLGS
jgi:methionyl-tRNA formyltransferase